ncbi:YbaK/EbsC family protein [Clostridium sp. A1-XYC3]|uniref:YbaK/EbsC family protein n=1 Tax=Clostridium tanneri TaxID=3037988 RepID=A0ABU4JUE2_9CLOT|nr:YbaK/EbsC family protein [Clostridium sp. A1-XYC3]MDW8801761.1 YbaK/EbsC family protein [Clostridium sp. A1-XYC3]
MIKLKEFEEKLKEYIIENNIDAEQHIYENTCHTVEEAASAANASPKDIVKSICLIGNEGNLIVAIVGGNDRVSTSRVAKALNIEIPKIATPEEILNKTGYICGGVPSFGYEGIFLIDPKVMENEFVYTGGGSPYSLTKISAKVLQQINKGQIVRIRK